MLYGMRQNGSPNWFWRTASLGAVLISVGLAGRYSAEAATFCTPQDALLPAAGHHIPAGYSSKSQAILKGTPSKLDLIRSKQSALPAPLMAPVSFVPDIVFRAPALKIQNPFLGNYTADMAGSALALPFRAADEPFQPASLPLAAAPMHLASNQPRGGFCNPAPIAAAPAIATTVKQPIRPGNPDVFGSVALAVSRTTLDDKWRPVAHAGLAGRAGPWSAIVASARNLDRAAQVSAVNSWVNGRIDYVEDARQYGAVDYWASAAQSLTRGRGDCEDYAIAKMQILRALGVSADSMYLVIARDLVRRIDHAVLAVALNGDLMVLDNETNRILSSAELKDYKPLLSFNTTKRWTHGYRIETPATPVRYAANGNPPATPPAL